MATCVWVFGAGMTVLRTFWDAATALDAGAVRHDQARTRPGAYYATLEPRQRELRQEAWRRLGSQAGPFRLTARAWYVRGYA
ncbi:MAG: hypothetical protein ACRDLD_06920 [Thermoleophilaceae bacterium]